ncbi:MAG TPA: NADH-quinone oxidoreductase subunit E, partial [Rhodobacteraceae bacterium]|nr:NADH-quinone oxidoreductase subunit E [Paracoccaceae bacterium]
GAKAAAKPKAAAPVAFAAVDDAAVDAAGAGSKPKGLAGPKAGKADDLKLIEGIGPVLEKVCHDNGVYHFDQIAAWGPAEVAWMNGNMPRFKGRVSRDKWVAQARLI